MVAFFDWFIHRDTLALLRLLEAADYFDPQSYNPVFQQQLDALLSRITDSEARRQILELRPFDFGNYVSRSLRRAGITKGEEENAYQQIIIKLLVSPGGLFARWQPGNTARWRGDSVEAFGTASGTSSRKIGTGGGGWSVLILR